MTSKDNSLIIMRAPYGKPEPNEYFVNQVKIQQARNCNSISKIYLDMYLVFQSSELFDELKVLAQKHSRLSKLSLTLMTVLNIESMIPMLISIVNLFNHIGMLRVLFLSNKCENTVGDLIAKYLHESTHVSKLHIEANSDIIFSVVEQAKNNESITQISLIFSSVSVSSVKCNKIPTSDKINKISFRSCNYSAVEEDYVPFCSKIIKANPLCTHLKMFNIIDIEPILIFIESPHSKKLLFNNKHNFEYNYDMFGDSISLLINKLAESNIEYFETNYVPQEEFPHIVTMVDTNESLNYVYTQCIASSAESLKLFEALAKNPTIKTFICKLTLTDDNEENMINRCEEMLSKNFVLTHVNFEFERNDRITSAKLENMTSRNKVIADQPRFAKAKAIAHSQN